MLPSQLSVKSLWASCWRCLSTGVGSMIHVLRLQPTTHAYPQTGILKGCDCASGAGCLLPSSYVLACVLFHSLFHSPEFDYWSHSALVTLVIFLEPVPRLEVWTP